MYYDSVFCVNLLYSVWKLFSSLEETARIHHQGRQWPGAQPMQEIAGVRWQGHGII
jgi:hypothetical protein